MHCFFRPRIKLLEDLDIKKLKFNPPIEIPTVHLRSKKITKRNMFEAGTLVLNDLKLQNDVNRIFTEEDDDDDKDYGEPFRKILKLQ